MPTGLRIVFDHLPAMQAAMRPAITAAIQKSLGDAQQWIEEQMASSGSPSGPGEAPAVVTGELVGSLVIDAASDLHGALIADGGHAVYLEFGTSKMAPRPFMQPAAAHIVEPLAKDVQKVLEFGG